MSAEINEGKISDTISSKSNLVALAWYFLYLYYQGCRKNDEGLFTLDVNKKISKLFNLIFTFAGRTDQAFLVAFGSRFDLWQTCATCLIQL